MFIGPLEATNLGRPAVSKGVKRFLDRAWRLFVDEDSGSWMLEDVPATDDQHRALHKTIKKVTEDIEAMRFNTGISAMMEFVNVMTKSQTRPAAVLTPFIQLLAPFAPHLGEELWARAGVKGELSYAKWPIVEDKWLVEDSKTYAVQVNGKVRGQVQLPMDVDQTTAIEAAKADPNVSRHLDGKTIVREIFVKNRMINLVAK